MRADRRAGVGLALTLAVAAAPLPRLEAASSDGRDASGRSGADWWAWQPVRRPAPPAVRDPAWGRSPIDAFILARLEAAQLAPSAPADRRVLIRRLSFDLLGLPPQPAAVEAFVADPAPNAYERLVDRLLVSPAYGERWARHWLDVARYGESQGFERDKLRPNAWRYRDWVIGALNRDLPYDEFARLQIAGDVLRPGDPDAITATGFLVAGAYDEVGQSQQSAAMRAIVRQDELEDIVGTVGQTFLGLTVQCARCHDHKFDPVPQREYYQLTAALAGVRHGERDIRTNADRATAALPARIATLERVLTAIDEPARRAMLAERKRADRPAPEPPTPVARWDFDTDARDALGGWHGTAKGGARIAGGRLVVDGRSAYVATVPIMKNLRAKTLEAWVSLKSLKQRGGGVVSVQTLDGDVFDAIVFGERDPGRWTAGSNGFARTQSFGGPAEAEADRQPVHIAIVYDADGTITGYRNGQPYGQPYQSNGPVTFKAGQAQVVFGLRHGAPGGNRMLAGAIHRAQVYDRALDAAEVAASAEVENTFVSEAQIVARLAPDQQARRTQLRAELAHTRGQLRRAKATKVYAVTPRQPETAHVLERGNTTRKGAVVSAGGVAAVRGVNADFALPPDAPEADRRIKLAAWMTDRHNPLFARVIVNRVWHYHFGVGLVETPNDFGFNGGRPSHPALVDWLASDLIRHDWSLKALHRAILRSATYCQSSRFREAAARVDAGNRLLWRKSPLRLEAEAVRDALLTVAGELEAQCGGPGYHDFETKTNNTQFYVPIDPVGRAFQRRSIYRTWVRSGRSPFLDVFDCPDPSTTAPRRAVTTTPLQALALLNNSFVLRMADRLAARLAREAGDDLGERIHSLFMLAYGRRAAADEVARLRPFVDAHGLPALCRVILNSSEFLYVD